MNTEHIVVEAFRKPAFRGAILRYTTLLEFSLEATLALYILRPERLQEGRDLLIADLQFGRKIDLLQKLSIPSTKSKSAALDGLRAFQRLRNLASHRAHVTRADARELLKNTTVTAMFADSALFESTFRRTRNALERIQRTRAFGPNARAAAEAVALEDVLHVFL